jgi:hypothetical protein
MNQNYKIILKGNSTEVVKSIKLKTTTSKTRRRTLSRKDFKSEREYNNHLLKALKPYVEYITKHKI